MKNISKKNSTNADDDRVKYIVRKNRATNKENSTAQNVFNQQIDAM